MLDPYIGESMLSIIDINYGIKEPTHGIQYCIPGQIWIFGGYLKARNLCILSYCLGQYILDHIDNRAKDMKALYGI